MLAVEMSRLALAETDEARAWYELYAQLGEEFVDEVARMVDSIRESPHRFPIYKGQVRRCGLKRFPYLIFFDVKPTKIRIHRVVHTSRDPGPIQDLLPDS